jgi:hypothetical protein
MSETNSRGKGFSIAIMAGMMLTSGPKQRLLAQLALLHSM